MYRTLFTLIYIALAGTPVSTIADSSNHELTLEMANHCILLNKDLNTASQQLIKTETEKAEIASKIRYLDGAIDQRHALINQLDQTPDQQNNENYNQLIQQFENLTEERRETISDYNQQHQLHVIQHESVIRLEQRFNKKCLSNISIAEATYSKACEDELSSVRWCQAFSFE